MFWLPDESRMPASPRDPDDTELTRASRRRFLTGAAGLAAVGAAGTRADANPKNLPPNVPSWTRALGDGAGVRPYGQPSKFEKHVVRRDVPWLTATRESSVSFTPPHELDGIIKTGSASSATTEASPRSIRRIIG
jgi:sulfane dehydrogenase subunit SoxC